MKRVFITAGLACALALPQIAAAQSADRPVQGKAGAAGQGGTAVAQPSTAGHSKMAPEQKTASDQTAQGSAAVGAADKAFATSAARGGLAEVEMGKLAADHAGSADVKQFGQRMADDHGKANDELKGWASKASVALPTEPSAKQKADLKRISGLHGEAFDRAYMALMVADHNKDVAEFRRASTTARNADLKAWAGKTLPTLEEHQKMARDIAGKVGKGAHGSSDTAAPAKRKTSGSTADSPSGR